MNDYNPKEELAIVAIIVFLLTVFFKVAIWVN
jgi:hypothetical protein